MKLLVCIKQVPSGSVPTDGAGNLDRSQGGSQLNPGDFYAVEAALELAEAFHGSVTALSMGPPSAEAVLRTAVSMGAAEGVLLSDRAFAGADVYATARTLAQGIRSLGTFDLIICGQQTTDGDTAQLPFSLAAQLELPALGWVKKLELQQERLSVLQELSGGTQRAVCPVPCLLAVGQEIGRPRIPSLRDQLRARSSKIRHLSLEDLPDRDPTHYGLAASPTRVVSVRDIEKKPRHSPLSLSGRDGAERLLSLVREVGSGEA